MRKLLTILVCITFFNCKNEKQSTSSKNEKTTEITSAKDTTNNKSDKHFKIIKKKKVKGIDFNKDSTIVAFERGEYIYTYVPKTGKLTKIVEGSDPEISPYGDQIAYTKNIKSEKGYSIRPHREIYVYNLSSKTEFRINVNDTNFYGPKWSPDATYIAFSIRRNRNWCIGIYNIETATYSIISDTNGEGAYSSSWGEHSEHIYFANFNTLFKYDTEGVLKDTVSMKKFSDKSLSSSGNFNYDQSNQNIIFMATDPASDDYFPSDFKFPLEALYCYHVETQSKRRLTRKFLNCSRFTFDYTDAIYFSGRKEDHKRSNIYRIKLKDTTLRLLIKDAYGPSIGNTTLKYIYEE
jgi:Tol biopolymer transport system component